MDAEVLQKYIAPQSSSGLIRHKCGASWSESGPPHLCDGCGFLQEKEASESKVPLGGEASGAGAKGGSLPTTSRGLSSSAKIGAETGVLGESSWNDGGGALGEGSPEDDLYEESEAIQVLVRVRPLLDYEAGGERNATEVVQLEDDHTVSIVANDANKNVRCRFDGVLGPDTTQETIYARIRSCTLSVLDGYNSTIFAYGQTGSGKTHTMFGPPGYHRDLAARRDVVTEHAGIIPRAIHDIFNGAQREEVGDFQVFVSFVQIYNESLYDMLRDASRLVPLQIREEPGQTESDSHAVYVEGLSEFAVRNAADCLSLIRIGEENRAQRETNMNAFSSRSHSVFQLVVEQRLASSEGERFLRSKFNLVDLAGSEKWDTRVDLHEDHQRELTKINLSLHTLGRCIAALAKISKEDNKGAAHVPYRDSKLTRLLADSLGGNCKTRVVATLSPASDCLEESVGTLRFADRAKQVMVRVRQNETRPVDHVMVNNLKKENQKLRNLVFEMKSCLERHNIPFDLSDEAGKDRSRRKASHAPDRNAEAQADLSAGPSALERLVREARAKSAQLQKENDLLTQEMAKLKHEASQAKAPAPSDSAPRAGPLEVESVPEQDTSEAEATLERIEGTLGSFFSFEIEEDRLQSEVERIFADYKRKVEVRRETRSLMTQHLPRLKPSKPAQTTHIRRHSLPSRSQNVQHSVEGRINNGSNNQSQVITTAAEGPPGAGAPGLNWRRVGQLGQPSSDSAGQTPLSTDRLRPSVPGPNSLGLTFRLRGNAKKDPSTDDGVPSEWFDPDELRQSQEAKVRKELASARQRMKNNLKLQEWLQQKEAKELEAIEAEEAQVLRQEQERKDRDERFRIRAAKQKAKLMRYYAKQQALMLAEKEPQLNLGGNVHESLSEA